MIKFFVERNSSVPFHTQIKEQIKIALALGQLRDGVVLPSIREVEASLGIGRMVVLRAYRELERCGILALKRGRGVTVNHAPSPEAASKILREYTRLAGRLAVDLDRQGLDRTSFARFFYRNCLLQDTKEGPAVFVDSSVPFAQENADQVSAVWDVPMIGISIDRLGAMGKRDLRKIRTIVTNYYRFAEVSDLVKPLRITVVPISFDWSAETLRVLRGVPAGSEILVLQSHDDYERHAPVFRKMLEDAFHHRKIHFQMQEYRGEDQVRAALRSKKHARIMISNRVWESVPENLRRVPKVFRPQIHLSVESILEAQLEAGIVV